MGFDFLCPSRYFIFSTILFIMKVIKNKHMDEIIIKRANFEAIMKLEKT
jgi:hypothetical protein